MAFRRRLTSLKRFAVDVFENWGSNLTAKKSHYQRSYLDLTKTLSLMCNGTLNSVKIDHRSAPDMRNVSLMQLIQQKSQFNTDYYLASNAGKQSSNPNPTGISRMFTSSHLTKLSQKINHLSISRNITTLVPNKSRMVVLQAVINDINFNCCKMKHSLPKVPPTRMMSIYDLERAITDEEAAKEFVYALKAGERKFLYEELARFHGDTSIIGNLANEPPTRQQLKLVTLHQMFPFIGFGFLDNFLMIVAGEYIDLMLGATLGISTMAAAALGNWFSDVCGLGSAHYVETFVARFGIRHPHLSPAQVDMKSTKWASNFGKVIGVTIGCFLGMIPLLFFREGKKKEQKGKEKKDATDENEPKK